VLGHTSILPRKGKRSDHRRHAVANLMWNPFEPLLPLNKLKVWGVTQVVDYLPNKWEAQNSNSNISKKTKQQQQKKQTQNLKPHHVHRIWSIVFLDGAGGWTQGLVHARLVLYHWDSYLVLTFCLMTKMGTYWKPTSTQLGLHYEGYLVLDTKVNSVKPRMS
jgi:hypothetical protein